MEGTFIKTPNTPTTAEATGGNEPPRFINRNEDRPVPTIHQKYIEKDKEVEEKQHQKESGSSQSTSSTSRQQSSTQSSQGSPQGTRRDTTNESSKDRDWGVRSGSSGTNPNRVAIGGLSERMSHRHTHLIAIDASQNSKEAFRWADKNLPKGDRFILFNALRHVPYVEGPMETLDLDARDRTLERMRKERAQLFDRYKIECAKSKRDCVVAAPDEEFSSATALGRAVCDTAKDLRSKSVICGSRGLSGMSSFMLGSISSKIVNSCDCSVTVVRPHEHKKKHKYEGQQLK